MAGLWDPKRELLPWTYGDRGTITWDEKEEGLGWRQYSGTFGTSKSSIYTHAVGLPRLISEYAERVLTNVARIASSPAAAGEFVKSNALPRGSMDAMGRFEPPILLEQAVAARLRFGEDVTHIVMDGLRGLGDSAALDDGEFLGRLQLRGRDYGGGCAICLAEEGMGTRGARGAKEIVVFRPCGHSLCVDPCFAQLVEKLPNLQMSDRTEIKTANGMQFTMQKHDVEGVRNFPCPLCRGIVETCFRAEDVGLGKDSAIRKRLRDYASRFSFEAIPERYLTAAREMLIEECAKAAAETKRLEEEEESRRREMIPIVTDLVRKSLEEPKEQQSIRRGYDHARKWHWGTIKRWNGWTDSWSSYHLLRAFQTPESFPHFYDDKAVWTCCGAAPHDVGCRPCPHIGYHCHCGTGVPIQGSDEDNDPVCSLSSQDIAGIYADVLSSNRDRSKKSFKVRNLFRKRSEGMDK